MHQRLAVLPLPFARSPAMTRRAGVGLVSLLAVWAMAGGAPVAAATLDSSAGPLAVTAMVSGLNEPWALEFLPDGGVLITEREGRLLHVKEGSSQPVAGLPEVFDNGQGGLLDVMIPRDFAQTREVWLSFSIPLEGGAATAVGKGVLNADGTAIEGFSTLYHGDATGGGRHFGSRLVEAADGTVFLTTGDRGTGPDGMESQDPMRVEGKVIHLNRDGSPATTLPGHRPGVYSLGHRNAQGAALDAEGNLWLVEHGAQGGD
ncbi:MAG: hypothetical protein C0427_01270, partial [Rhodobacter sp.]|nr:hypothetical protein [Rhodobacter sp.]